MQSPARRWEVKRRIGESVWPVIASVSSSYRRTLARRTRIVAVVGSVGKTTTMRTISAVLGQRVSRPALLNMNSHAAVGRALLGIRPWHKSAVLEVAVNGRGQMRRQAATVRPDVVVVTAIARDHWESFSSLEVTRDEKAAIVRVLSPRGVAILNADDPNVRWMATQTQARVIFMGEAPDADVRATDVELEWPRGMSFVAHIDGRAHRVRTRLMGRHMVHAALAALAVAHVEGLPIDAAVAAVESVEATPGRMQAIVLPSGAVVVRDEFKGTLDAWFAALETFATLPARRRIAVAGEISETTGNQDYRDIGRKTGQVADRAIFVGTSKNLQLFRTGAAAGGLSRDRISHVHHWWEAVELLRDELSEGDVVLIRGRWQQALGRVGLALAGGQVLCRADPCPFKRMLCDVCPYLMQSFSGSAR